MARQRLDVFRVGGGGESRGPKREINTGYDWYGELVGLKITTARLNPPNV